MRLQQRQVQFSDQASPVSDWLWIDDYHDHINVLVGEAPNASVTGSKRQFSVFDQSIYAVEGRPSVAIIVGIIEPGESPDLAAALEVEEEMHAKCDQMHRLG